MPQVLIIGGGPAGGLAGVLLARRGWDVTIIEQHAFPRDKVCGECVSALGVSVLWRHRLLETLESLGAAELRYSMLFAGDGAAARVEVGEPMLGISRAAMDQALLQRAREQGATVLQPARCERMRPCDGGVEVVLRDLLTNDMRTRRADAALIADGKGALLPARPAATTDFGIKAHFVGVDAARDAIGLYGVWGHYGGVAPIEAGRFNAAFSVPAELLQRHRRDLDGLFAEMMRANVALRRAFRDARRVGDWLASPLPRFGVAEQWPAHIVPIGNAAAALEPIGGEGIGLALHSAELAVESLSAEPHAAHRPALRAKFTRLWQVRRAACRAVAQLLSNPRWAPPVVELLRVNPELARGVLRLTGKEFNAGTGIAGAAGQARS